MSTVEERLRLGMEALAIDHNRIERTLPILLHYLTDLELGARRYGLISREDASSTERIVDRHLLDSLQPWSFVGALLDEGRRVLYDIGSGAGLPGVPLAALFATEIDACILVERRTKRARFLEAVAAALSELPIRVVERDAYHLVRPGELSIDGAVVLFRAWTPADAEMSRQLRRVFAPGTPIVMYKGRPRAAEEEAALLRATGDYDSVHVEPLAERSIIVARITRSC